MMMLAEVSETCKSLIIYVKAYFTGACLLVHYISVNIALVHRYGTFRSLFL
jgi:hypothetical protein